MFLRRLPARSLLGSVARFSSVSQGVVIKNITQNKLILTIDNQKNRNALSVTVLNQLNQELEKFKQNKFDGLSLKFQTDCSDYCCSGFDLFDFDTENIAKGGDPLPSTHPGNITMNLLREISLNYPTEIVINKHLIGFGIVLASLCNSISWLNPADIRMFLPHLRMGIGFPLLPMLAILDCFGPLLVTELLIANRAISGEEFIEKMKKYDIHSTNLVDDIAQCIRLIEKIRDGEQAIIGNKGWVVPDRIGQLNKLCDLHIKQFELFGKYRVDICKIPLTDRIKIEEMRLDCVGPRLAESINRHRLNPKDLNKKALIDILNSEAKTSLTPSLTK